MYTPNIVGDTYASFSNQIPADAATGIAYNTTVAFDLTDPMHDIDLSSVVIEIDGIEAYSSSSAQNSFSVAVLRLGDGYNFEITSPSVFTELTSVYVEVWAESVEPCFESFNDSYSFTTGYASAPYINYYEPTDNAVDQSRTPKIAFALGDMTGIDITTVLLYINGRVIYTGATDTFASAWSSSQKISNGLNGFDFILATSVPFDLGDTVEVRIYAENVLSLSVDFVWSFFVTQDGIVFSTYNMLRYSLRQHDKNSPSLLERLLTGTGGPDDLQKTLIYDRCSELSKLYDPFEIPAKFLPWLKSLVGFTRNMDLSANESEVREVIAKAGSLWNLKGSEPSFEVACRMVSNGRYRIQNWFDRRMQVDQTFITEMLLDYDPIALDFNTPTPEGSLWQNVGVAVSAYPLSQQFAITDLPTSFFPNRVFEKENEYAYLQLLDVPLDPARKGFYRITSLVKGTYLGYLDTSWVAPAGYYGATWRLWGANSEYVTEIRIVDKGDLNKDLFKYLIDVVRPNGERVDVVYLAFLDQFEDAKYISQWDATGGYVLDGEKIEVEAGGEIIVSDTAYNSWDLERQLSVRIRAKTASTVAKVYLLYDDANNNINATINYTTGALTVNRVNSGVTTAIGSAVTLAHLYYTDYWGVDYEYRDVFRFVMIRTNSGADAKIKVYRAGSLVYEQTYASVPFGAGKVGLASSGSSTYTDLVEVITLPASQDRVGPNP